MNLDPFILSIMSLSMLQDLNYKSLECEIDKNIFCERA